MLYMVTFTINIPQMLAYIPAPWILWVWERHRKSSKDLTTFGGNLAQDLAYHFVPGHASFSAFLACICTSWGCSKKRFGGTLWFSISIYFYLYVYVFVCNANIGLINPPPPRRSELYLVGHFLDPP